MSRAGVDRPTVRPYEHQTTAPVIGKVSQSEGTILPGRDLDRQPAVRAEAGAVGPLWVQACSLAGRGHTEGSSPSSGQDSYSYRLSEDGRTAVFAIADGLGSRPRSHVGAHLAALQACVSFGNPAVAHLLDGPPGHLPPDDAVLSAMREVAARVVAASPDKGGQDVATTLLVAILRLQAPTVSAAFVRVGDPSVLLTEQGRFTSRSLVFGAPDDGPANQLSACIPFKDPVEEIEVVRVGQLPPGVGVVLVTDGVGNDLAGSHELREWLEHRWAAPLDAAGMIDSLRYRRQGSLDDRTAVVILPSPTSPGGPPPGAPVVPHLPMPLSAPRPVAPAPGPPQQSGPVAGAAPSTSGRSRRRFWLVAGLAGLIGAVAIGLLLSSLGGSSRTASVLPQWIGPDQTGAMVVASDTAVVARDIANPGDSGWVVTSQSGGGLVAVDGCGTVVPVDATAAALPATHGCEEPLPPTLAVPQGEQILVLQGDELRLAGSPEAGVDVSSAPSGVREGAVDAAIAGTTVVLVGDGRAVIVAADGQTSAVLEGPTEGCADARFVATEALAGGDLVFAATCSADHWAVVGLAPSGGRTCVLYSGAGDPPAPVSLPSGADVLAFGTSGPSGALATAPIDGGCG